MCLFNGHDNDCDFCSEQMVTARKTHTCTECRRTITPGERYERTAGKWDGELHSFKTCRHCLEARSWLSDNCGGWLFGEVFADLWEHQQECAALQCLGFWRLVCGMRRKWADRQGRLYRVPDMSRVPGYPG